MARPKQFDDDQLLDSLRATFLELGPAASTQELARRAGVSEGTLFKRYHTKRDLFMAAMRLPQPETREWYVEMLDRAGRGSFETHLCDLAEGMYQLVNEIMPSMQIIIANGKLSPHEMACLIGDSEEPAPFVTLRRFGDFFQKEMDLGRIRRTDARALASLFLGAIVHDFHLRLHFPSYPHHEDAREQTQRIARTIAELTRLEPANDAALPSSITPLEASTTKSRVRAKR